MYNEEQKRRYINKIEDIGTVNVISSYFKKIESMEVKHNKDISTFTKPEIIELYKYLSSRVETLTNMNGIFGKYTDWCINQNLVPDCQNHFSMISTKNILECTNAEYYKKAIVKKEEIYAWADRLPNVSDKIVLLGLYEGIAGNGYIELQELDSKKIVDNNIELCTGRIIQISDKLKQLMLDNEYIYEYEALGKVGKRTLHLEDSGYVIKNFPNWADTSVGSEERQAKRYARWITRIAEYLNVGSWLKPRILLESGRLNYIKEKAEEYNMTPIDFIYNNDCAKIIDQQYDLNLTRNRKVYWFKYKEYFN